MSVSRNLKVEYVGGEFRARIREWEIVYGGDKAWSRIFPVGYKPHDGILPSEYFIASVGGCAIMHVAMFCRKHNVPCDGASIEISWKGNAREGELVDTIIMDVHAPAVAEQLKQDLIEELRNCTIVASICLPPKFEIQVNRH